MTIQIKEDRSNSKVFAEINDVSKATRRGIRQAFFRIGKDITREMNREILRKPKSGRIYIVRDRLGRRRRHVASAPFETHANLRGALRRSRGFKIRGQESMDVGYGVSASLFKPAPVYAKFVEFGTRQMKPRPSILNAITATQRNAESHFDREIGQELGASR